MAFDKAKYLEKFKIATRERIQKLNLGLLKLEKTPLDKALLDVAMRDAHTVKGSSVMFGYVRINELAHQMEEGLEKALNGKIKLEKNHFDMLFKCLDAIELLLDDKVTWKDKGIERPYAENLCKEIESVFTEKKLRRTATKKPKKENKVEDKKYVKKDDRGISISKPDVSMASGVGEEVIHVDIDKLDNLMKLSGELLISKIRLKELVDNLATKVESEEEKGQTFDALADDLKSAEEDINTLTNNVQSGVMDVRMIPVVYLFNAFPRAMRDLAYQKGKDIDFVMKGEDTQLDKSIIDNMKDPIMHLLRNAVDHGIEFPKVRESRNKSKTGRIELSAYQQGSQVVIEVSDDGRGIDIRKVKQRAVERGLVSQKKIGQMVDEQIYQLLFTPGFSTKEDVSSVSGRGVGLDVVRDKIVKLKGIVEVVSTADAGTKFIMRLPLTLAVTESLLVVVGNDTFAIPIDTVVETIRTTPEDIKTVEAKEAITVRGHILPLVRLNDLFGLSPRGIFEKRVFPVVIVQAAEKRIGILLDQLLGHQEIISKSLGDPLKKVKNITGATILGDGRVILILDIPSIIESAEGVIIKRPQVPPPAVTKAKREKTILIAEDAMSTASLEKSILESFGYSVIIARDGQEAIERASQEKIDLVITDVLMPRMDGFELTSRLKKDKLYQNIPIIIVTTRGSDADKRRGLEAGADAYILKSEFTSEGLLNTIERLLG